MNIKGFIALITPLEPLGLSVSRYEGLEDTFPRLVWCEWSIKQGYADDRAYVEYTTIIAELFTKIEDDPLLSAFKAACRAVELPFECDVDYDHDGKFIHYVFRIHLEEDI